ncbi:nucleotidyltransferase family protein [Leptolyngbya sp. 7M]|uniref:nucleotidyltransferase family protein n=1 Tax=Leptolyngbya sp. 7M TaxID=2812896 RepID=UPI001B8B407F|nr:nucleotidyltransferase family protein [Leptolyngbya sp. 7M]QYO67344.1 nucleotidyltransferase family protein [Leptolyngbya sp. 7M]
MGRTLTDDLRWNLLMAKRMEHRIASIADELHSHNVEFIMFKGWGAARSYPADSPRTYADIDIAVGSNDFEKVEEICKGAKSSLNGIDLHSEFRHLDTLPWKQHLSRAITVEIENVRVKVPCPEDHLRIIATHWLNDGGENKERLWDIYYAVANRPADFDWSKCLDVVSDTRRGWVICAIGLAHKYLGLDISDLPFRDEASKIPKWITATLEREWPRGERLQPLQTCLGDPKLFIRQLRKRIPPNPIQATIEMEASIDDCPRGLIQLRNMVHRASPSLGRIFTVATRKR